MREASVIGLTVSNFNPNKPFSFADYPITHKRIDKLLNELQTGISTVILNGIDAEWTLANNKNSELANVVFGDNIGKLTQEQYRRYYSNNHEAREAFIARKDSGLNLSDRVWRYSDQFKTEIEMGLDLGIRNGMSADEMSRDLRDYLQNPDKLFRRVRDAHGQLHLSKAAMVFHPGAGVYRSSYKNAMRLTRTETNIAYRTADFTRWQQLDFVVGIEIRLSNNHPCTDICDILAGKYPKDFKFTGWHPQCMCYAIPILKTMEEMQADNERIMNGEQVVNESTNSVSNVPDEFNKWFADNEGRISRAKSLPYFIRDNKQYSQTTAIVGRTSSTLDTVIQSMSKTKIDYNKVELLPKKINEIDIIARVGGGDLTRGSCSSLAFTYAGNKCGFDVLDFRDGASRQMFGMSGTIMNIAEKVGGVVSKNVNDFANAKILLTNVKAGKEYYFTCGAHAAIVRKIPTGYEYLELQSATNNGFKTLSNDVLKYRFGAKKSHTLYGTKYEVHECIIDIELLKNNTGFQKMLGYINTNESKQRKGLKGAMK